MIEIENLTKTFGKSSVLDGLNLKIDRGDRIALIGQNGAGKTTLIRVILGQYFHQGQVQVLGKNPRQNRVEILDKIGFVPQLPPPLQMSVKELIAFSTKVSRRSSLEKVHRYAEDLGLDTRADSGKFFQKLSGGMKQKLLIALALAREPEILIMDEPAANLDPQGRQAFFLQLMKAMKNTTMLLSSHRVDEVLNLINRIIEMDHGRIVKDDRIAHTALADKMLSCTVSFVSPNESAARVLDDWNFRIANGGTEFAGAFIGADRLRFLTAISNFANHIEKLNIH